MLTQWGSNKSSEGEHLKFSFEGIFEGIFFHFSLLLFLKQKF